MSTMIIGDEDECVHHDRPLRYLARGDSDLPWVLFAHDGRDWLTDRYAVWDVDFPPDGSPMREALNGIRPRADAPLGVTLVFTGFGEFTFVAGETRDPLPHGTGFLDRGGVEVRPSRWAYLMGDQPVAAWPRADGEMTWMGWELTKDVVQTVPRVTFEQSEDNRTPVRVIDQDRVVGALMPHRFPDPSDRGILDLIRISVGWTP